MSERREKFEKILKITYVLLLHRPLSGFSECKGHQTMTPFILPTYPMDIMHFWPFSHPPLKDMLWCSPAFSRNRGKWYQWGGKTSKSLVLVQTKLWLNPGDCNGSKPSARTWPWLAISERKLTCSHLRCNFEPLLCWKLISLSKIME